MGTAFVVGAGIFGVTGALELRRRGWDVELVDQGPIPAPLAESHDVSKVVRADYGPDEAYAEMGERALDGWRRLNAEWGEPLFHETGVLFVTRAPMAPGGFEHDSYACLSRRGHRLQRVDAAALRERFPAWSTGAYVDGYYNPQGGWVEAERVVARLVAKARADGVNVHENARVADLADVRRRADVTVVACGSWTPDLVPSLGGELRRVGQPVFHLVPDDPSLFQSPRFVVFGADLANTGWYGFPLSPGGIVKVANHGIGRATLPGAAVTPYEQEAMRSFLRATFPALAGARLAYTRICVYSDTRDEHFWVAPDPDDASLVVVGGGSGHAFKFGPLLGGLIADAVEGRVVPKFRWRGGGAAHRDSGGEEASRHRA
jgi:glycine/D-amino acid oxidase-like deaminating enzyme